ncbi:uncharacterized protein FA14DRAFT_77683 [Meira miltonrushii]|uniref:Uncharacterized protein n=1 Tax=Meira miltonrushii TaxID=1280837 RepID=A0A316V6A8_9BASI|nr:uncharacterized protein FA14DRAFT_77683 [Meira miltonrushii]PWN32784.1 hypothetical protein FA14DRAFT_77683 [Meira miltonrushii]
MELTEMFATLRNDNETLKAKLAEAEKNAKEAKPSEEHQKKIDELENQLKNAKSNGDSSAEVAAIQKKMNQLEESHATDISKLMKEHDEERLKTSARIKELEVLASRVKELEQELADAQFALQETQKTFATQLAEIEERAKNQATPSGVPGSEGVLVS